MPSSNANSADKYTLERKARSCGEDWTEKSLPWGRTIDLAKNVSHLQARKPGLPVGFRSGDGLHLGPGDSLGTSQREDCATHTSLTSDLAIRLVLATEM